MKTMFRKSQPLWSPWRTKGPGAFTSQSIAPPVTPTTGRPSTVFTPFRKILNWRCTNKTSMCCHSPNGFSAEASGSESPHRTPLLRLSRAQPYESQMLTSNRPLSQTPELLSSGRRKSNDSLPSPKSRR